MKIIVVTNRCFFTNVILYVTLNFCEELVIYSSVCLDSCNEDTCMCAYKYPE